MERSLAERIKLNLEHYNLWTQVSILSQDETFFVLKGKPSAKLPAADQVRQNYSRNTVADVDMDVSSISTLVSAPISLPDQDELEWVYPILKDTKLTMQKLDQVFHNIAELNFSIRPKKILLGIMDIDGTVVYYFVHDGVAKPRQS